MAQSDSPGRTTSSIKEQILRALSHPEAEEGLYFRNFFHLHEEDERQVVSGEEADIMRALEELIVEGVVAITPSADPQQEAIFRLAAR